MARISADEAASRLGVKRSTLYAYVSRGQLRSHRQPGTRSSTFDAAEVDRLAARGRRAERGPGAGLEVVIDTHLTSIEPGGHRYRTRSAADLARTDTFEAAAEWLWRGAGPGSPTRWRPDPDAAAVCRAAQAVLPPDTPLIDRLRLTVTTAAPADPLRYDLRPDSVVAGAQSLLALMVESLPVIGSPGRVPLSLAGRLWSRLSPRSPSPGLLRALDGALVLMADHELAVSTLAARIAASVRADPYSVVGTGLGVIGGTFHGPTIAAVCALLADVSQPDEAGRVVGQHLQRDGEIPGFGHPLYPDGDPRAQVLLDLLDRAQPDPARWAAVQAVVDVAARRSPLAPNVDFALAALSDVGEMVPGAGEAVVAIARSAGWIAHALEEYAAPHHFRPLTG